MIPAMQHSNPVTDFHVHRSRSTSMLYSEKPAMQLMTMTG